MPLYTVKYTETITATYTVECNADNETEAKNTALDILTNHDEAREACLTSEKLHDEPTLTVSLA